METPKKMANWVTKKKRIPIEDAYIPSQDWTIFHFPAIFTSTILHDFNKKRVFVAIMEAKLELGLG